jgi:hypothetical protein
MTRERYSRPANTVAGSLSASSGTVRCLLPKDSAQVPERIRDCRKRKANVSSPLAGPTLTKRILWTGGSLFHDAGQILTFYMQLRKITAGQSTRYGMYCSSQSMECQKGCSPTNRSPTQNSNFNRFRSRIRAFFPLFMRSSQTLALANEWAMITIPTRCKVVCRCLVRSKRLTT